MPHGAILASIGVILKSSYKRNKIHRIFYSAIATDISTSQ